MGNFGAELMGAETSWQLIQSRPSALCACWGGPRPHPSSGKAAGSEFVAMVRCPMSVCQFHLHSRGYCSTMAVSDDDEGETLA